MELRLALIGFGNAGKAFARLLLAKRRELDRERGLHLSVTAIATGRHGIAVDPAGIDLRRALRLVEADRSLDRLHRGAAIASTADLIRQRPADVVFEITPLEPRTGQPALDHIRSALEGGMHVVTANKGPVALGYRELRRLARERRRAFRFEGTVMDGAPVFNLVEKTLPGTRVEGFYGILNSTTNFVLTEMERGRRFETSLARAQALGIAEADADYDLDGWDAAVKAAVLANVLLGARLAPRDVPRRGIRSISAESLIRARKSGRAIRLVARGSRSAGRVVARVGPETLPPESPLSRVAGTTNALVLQTDTMKELLVLESDPGVEQTAYALLSDLLSIAETPGCR